jgi:alkylation response protein AidB-like acyl-CoA dehydrogenase
MRLALRNPGDPPGRPGEARVAAGVLGAPPRGAHVVTSGEVPGWADDLVRDAAVTGEDALAALQLARTYGARLALPGRGETPARWSVLAAVARANLTVARVLEAHTDALAILAEGGLDVPATTTMGVFAAESGEHRLEATERGGEIVLSGVKPWCSLAGDLEGALVTAHADGDRQLFRVNLRHPSVTPEPAEGWVARGLRTIPSGPVRFDHTPAIPVGPPGWYLERPGFAWGGMGVAACWHGGAVGIAATVRRVAARRSGELNDLHLGIIDTALHASEATLADAARAIDAGRADGRSGQVLALKVRNVVADAAERVVHQAGHALGPGPLAFDEDHVRRVSDLTLYVRQHHGERDLAALGAAVRESGA